VEQAYRDAEVAGRSLATARQAIAAAEEARRISADRYASGLLPLTDLLDAETGLVEARLAEIAARHDTIVGRVRLQRAAGRLEVPR
jgi:outer membrane protein TolC